MNKGLVTLLILVLISRSFFLGGGYGNEEDSWSAVVTAFESYESGEYVMSRLPGHPVYESILSTLWPISHSPWVYNGISTLGCLLAVWAFYRIASRKIPNRAWSASLVFASVPVLFSASTSTIDYVPSLALLLWAWDSVERERWALAALLLGLAAGMRLSHLTFGLPLFLLLLHPEKKRKALYFAALCFLTTCLAYLPPYLTYGAAFFDTYDLPYPPLPKVIYKATVDVWGLFGLLGLLCWFGAACWSRDRNWSTIIRPFSRLKSVAWALAIALPAAVYFSLPEKAAFWIPALMPILITGAQFAPRKAYVIGCVAFCLAPWIFGMELSDPLRGVSPSETAFTFENSGQEVVLAPFAGEVLLDYRKRQAKLEYVDRLVRQIEHIDEPTFLTAGWWFPFLQVQELRDGTKTPINPKVEIVYFATENQLKAARNSGKSIYYTPETARFNEQKYGHVLLEQYGSELKPGL